MTRSILEFIGGCWDGMNLASDSLDLIERERANRVLQDTQQGSVGRRVWMPAAYAVRRWPDHLCPYVVTCRTEIDGDVLVRLEFQPSEPPQGSLADSRQILLYFQQGPLHNQVLDSGSEHPLVAMLAIVYYCEVDGGVADRCLEVIPAVWRQIGLHSAADGHSVCTRWLYRVAQCCEDAQSVRIRLEFRSHHRMEKGES